MSINHCAPAAGSSFPIPGGALASEPALSGTFPGYFISLEGGDWTGKSTQLRLLEAAFSKLFGADLTRCTFEPGGTALGMTLRQAVMHGEQLNSRTEALLYAADRAHHVDSQIRPWLERGKVVITDRYLDSSLAYQGRGRDLGVPTIRNLSLWATGGLLPDLTFVLDADPAVLVSRRANTELDRIEQAGMDFHCQVRDSFRDLVYQQVVEPDYPPRLHLVDAAASIPQVHGQLISILRKQVNQQLDTFSHPDGLKLLADLASLSPLTNAEIDRITAVETQ